MVKNVARTQGGSASTRPRLLVLTSTLPRWSGDPEPRFVLDLAKAVSTDFNVVILAPMSFGAARREVLEGVEIERYRYFPIAKLERLASPGAIMPNLKRHHWLWLTVPGLFVCQLVKLAGLLRRQRFDAIHCHWIIPQGLVLTMLSAITRTPPWLVTCHGADAYTLNGRSTRWLKGMVLARASAISVVSSQIGEFLKSSIPMATDRAVRQIPMGVDLDRFRPVPPFEGKPPVILFVGRLAEKKGVHQLLQVLADPRMRSRDARLRIVGTGPLQGGLERLAAEIGVQELVTFAGAIPHDGLPMEFGRATVFCTPFVVTGDGDREGMPTVLLEAAATGVPIVTTDVGGCRDLIEDGKSGRLLPPGDVEALTKALIDTIDNPQRARDMADCARASAQRFSWNHIGRRYSEVLQSVLAEKEFGE